MAAITDTMEHALAAAAGWSWTDLDDMITYVERGMPGLTKVCSSATICQLLA